MNVEPADLGAALDRRALQPAIGDRGRAALRSRGISRRGAVIPIRAQPVHGRGHISEGANAESGDRQVEKESGMRVPAQCRRLTHKDSGRAPARRSSCARKTPACSSRTHSSGVRRRSSECRITRSSGGSALSMAVERRVFPFAERVWSMTISSTRGRSGKANQVAAMGSTSAVNRACHGRSAVFVCQRIY